MPIHYNLLFLYTILIRLYTEIWRFQLWIAMNEIDKLPSSEGIGKYV